MNSSISLEDFDITVKSPYPHIQECLIKRKDRNITFGVVIRSSESPPAEWVLHQFLTNPNVFFIEADEVVVTQLLITASAEPSNP